MTKDILNPYAAAPDPADGPPYTHNAPGHGPWVACEVCDGDGTWLDGIDLATCWACGGDGGHYEPLPPPSYTITDVSSDNEV